MSQRLKSFTTVGIAAMLAGLGAVLTIVNMTGAWLAGLLTLAAAGWLVYQTWRGTAGLLSIGVVTGGLVLCSLFVEPSAQSALVRAVWVALVISWAASLVTIFVNRG